MKNYTVITGYHGTCSKHVTSIVKYGLNPSKVKKRLTIGLGRDYIFMETCGRLSGGRRISALNHIIKILFQLFIVPIYQRRKSES